MRFATTKKNKIFETEPVQLTAWNAYFMLCIEFPIQYPPKLLLIKINKCMLIVTQSICSHSWFRWNCQIYVYFEFSWISSADGICVIERSNQFKWSRQYCLYSIHWEWIWNVRLDYCAKIKLFSMEYQMVLWLQWHCIWCVICIWRCISYFQLQSTNLCIKLSSR